eukprot:6160257-Pyramimonas_sp.AAC.1
MEGGVFETSFATVGDVQVFVEECEKLAKNIEAHVKELRTFIPSKHTHGDSRGGRLKEVATQVLGSDSLGYNMFAITGGRCLREKETMENFTISNITPSLQTPYDISNAPCMSCMSYLCWAQLPPGHGRHRVCQRMYPGPYCQRQRH